MSVFLTPDLKPVSGGTYFPPKDSFGRTGFKTVLLNLAKQVWGYYYYWLVKQYILDYLNELMFHFKTFMSFGTNVLSRANQTLLGDNTLMSYLNHILRASDDSVSCVTT